jgi:hypothetical protein
LRQKKKTRKEKPRLPEDQITSKYKEKGVQHMPSLQELRAKQTGRSYSDLEKER